MPDQEYILIEISLEAPPVEEGVADAGPLDSAGPLAAHLAAELAARGYGVDPVEEDWGWWIGVRTGAAAMAVGVYSAEAGPQDLRFAATVFTGKSRRWVFWPFRSVSIVPQLQALKRDLAAALENTPGLRISAVTAEYPL